MKRLFFLSVALLTVWAAAAQVRFVDATTLNLIGKAQPTSQPYHRIDTVAYKGFTKSENQQVRCGAGLALVFKTNSSRIDLLPEYTSFVYNGASTPRVASEGFDLYISITTARTASGCTPLRVRPANAARPSRLSRAWTAPRRSVCCTCPTTTS